MGRVNIRPLVWMVLGMALATLLLMYLRYTYDYHNTLLYQHKGQIQQPRVPLVSIGTLIFQSPRYADFIHDQVTRHTPWLQRGLAEFYFVANDASPIVLDHLEQRNYTFYVQRNERLSEEALFARGYGTPEYIHRVYRGWNRAVMQARGRIVCLVNSDNAFSPGWLEALVKRVESCATRGTPVIASALLVERGHERIGHFPASLNGQGSILHQCGRDPDSYNEACFQAFTNSVRRGNKTTRGGVYMPMCVERRYIIDSGMYPEGNLAGRSFDDVINTGDRALFERMAQRYHVRHVTDWGAVAYHFQQGEQEFTPRH